MERMTQLLSRQEIDRAGRFHFPHHRKHFIAARSVLRFLLSRLSGIDPHRIKFAYTQHEKPYLPESRLNFNISHTDNLALMAFSLDRRVGVDIEHIRSTIDETQIARRFFARSEFEEYLAVPQARRMQAFYNAWTRKEAYIKAIGDGLTFPLHDFRVSLKPEEPAQLIAVRSDPEEAARWKLVAVDPGSGMTGALMADQLPWEPVGWDFEYPEQLSIF